MSNQRYPEEFKTEAVTQVAERALRAADLAVRLACIPGYNASASPIAAQQVDDQVACARNSSGPTQDLRRPASAGAVAGIAWLA